MSSSIHTIYRSRDSPFSPTFSRSKEAAIPEDYFANHPSEDDENTEDADFDESASAPQEGLSGSHNDNQASVASSNGINVRDPPITPSRMGFLRAASIATVRLKRRSKLAGKLREVFDIADIKAVVAGI